MNSNILETLNIPNIPTNRHYWIIRTNGGVYYQDFVLHGYISIAWDYITLSMLNTESEDTIKHLIEIYSSDKDQNNNDEDDLNSSSKGKITSTYNKIHRFVFEIRQGDIVLIPSANSDQVTIAEIVGDAYEDPNYVNAYLKANPDPEFPPCPHHKRRTIRELKTVVKSRMDIYLSKAFSSQHALSNMDDYAPFIDRTIYGIYAKGDDIHATIHAGHPNGLSLKELVSLSKLLEESASQLAEQCGIPFDSSNIEVKLNIHSPGLIELVGAASGIGIVLSLLMFSLNNLINGGKLSLSLKKDATNGNLDFSITSETPGLKGRKIDEEQLTLQKKKELLEMVSELDIKSPEIVKAILNDEKMISAESIESPTDTSLTKSENPVE